MEFKVRDYVTIRGNMTHIHKVQFYFLQERYLATFCICGCKAAACGPISMFEKLDVNKLSELEKLIYRID